MKEKFKKFVRFVFSKNMFLVLSLVLQGCLLVAIYSVTNIYISKILGGAITIFAFLLALYINSTRKHPDTKLAYIILLVLFPLYGTLTYFFSWLGMGNRKFKKHIKRMELQTTPLKQNEALINSLPESRIKGIANYMYNTQHFPSYEHTKCTYFSSGENMYKDILKELKSAKHFIFLEYYIIQHGKMLDSIVEILKQKVKDGVEVRFMYDGTSSIAKIPHKFAKEMNKVGINCKMFMPVRAILSTEQNNRDHRKLLIVDNKICFTGGINLADEYINEVQPYGYWKDVGIKLKGQAVTSFTQMFLKMWNFKQKEIENFAPYLNEYMGEENDGIIIPIGDHPHDNEDISKNLILHILANAKKYVHITTPYLILDDDLRNAIISTARKGVDISIVTPNTPDKKIIYLATQTNYKPLIDAGVKIYQYLPGFIHAKMIVSDNKCAMLGTVNFDYRSLFLNFENAVYIYHNSKITDIENDYQSIVNESKLITKQEYKKINPFKRFFGKLIKIFTPLM